VGILKGLYSAFYKQPMFFLLYLDDGKAVMTDDTSDFICLDRYDNLTTAKQALHLLYYVTLNLLQK